MYDFSKRSETQKYISEILEAVKGAKIIGITSEAWISKYPILFTYTQDKPIFIKFDNGKCLIVTYLEIDRLKIEYREMSEEEIDYYGHFFNDCFNRVSKVYSSAESKEVESVQSSSLEYGSLTSIELTPVVGKYWSWVKNHLIEVDSTEETFGRMTFYMDNGKKFIIEPEDAQDDGYSDLWSPDAIQSEVKPD